MPAVLVGMMMAGVLLDCIRIGHEGTGGLIAVLSGIVFYVYFLYQMFVLTQTYSADQTAALAGTLVLFLSGALFFLCGRRRIKMNK